MFYVVYIITTDIITTDFIIRFMVECGELLLDSLLYFMYVVYLEYYVVWWHKYKENAEYNEICHGSNPLRNFII